MVSRNKYRSAGDGGGCRFNGRAMSDWVGRLDGFAMQRGSGSHRAKFALKGWSMSNPVQVTPSRRGRWLAGLPSLSVAVGLALIYNFVPSWTWQLSVLGRVMFRAVVVLFGMIGLAQIASAWSGTKGTIATPGFGRHRMVLPVEGIVYLVIMFSMFIGAMLTKSNMLLLVFALMAGPFVINGWMTYGMLRSAGAARTAPHRAMVGELFSVELELTNDRRLLSIWVMAVRDAITHPREDLVANVLFAQIGRAHV